MAEQVESPPLPNLVTGRVLGLDALRFWLAFVVFMGHGAWASYLDLGDFKFGSLIKGFLANAACGPAAVTVFFVVSGFCIHFPYRSGTKQLPDLGSFLVRRWVRTLVPLGIAYLVAFGLTARWDALTMVVWSLVCEEIYYLLYPSLLSGSRKIGWPKLLAGSMVAALAVILTKPDTVMIWTYGYALTWIVGLPAWLLGCVLAENSDRLRTEIPKARFSIGWWRFAAWILATGASMVRFHGGIGYPWTLTLFAFFAYFWLQREIVHYREHRPNPGFEWLGGVSYSLYLMHLPFLIVLKDLVPDRNVLLWGVSIIVAGVALCILFGVLVERPSHHAARWLGARIAERAKLRRSNILQT
jgi:peptidoglycan/LPS O-acetylase OafA/YrhL